MSLPSKLHDISYRYIITVQSNLSYMTFQGKIKIGSHKTGGHLIQV